MKIDRSKFEQMSAEEARALSVWVHLTDDPEFPYKATCAMCDEEYDGSGTCQKCHHCRKLFAVNDGVFSRVEPTESLESFLNSMNLKFVGYSARENDLSELHDTIDQACTAYQEWTFAEDECDRYMYMSG